MLIDIAETIRKRGVGVMFISQRLINLETDIRGNVSTRMYLKLRNSLDRKDAQDEIGVEMAQALGEKKLKKGMGVVDSPSYDEPFFVKFKPCYARHNPPLDPDEIKQLMQKYKP